jgi:hypothetical protein
MDAAAPGMTSAVSTDTDTLYADTPAWGEFTCIQVFAGSATYFIGVHECKTDGEFARILQDEIRHNGAMDRLVSDRAKAEISKKVEDIMRIYTIDGHQSKPYQQHQNPDPVERQSKISSDLLCQHLANNTQQYPSGSGR